MLSCPLVVQGVAEGLALLRDWQSCALSLGTWWGLDARSLLHPSVMFMAFPNCSGGIHFCESSCIYSESVPVFPFVLTMKPAHRWLSSTCVLTCPHAAVTQERDASVQEPA